MRPKFNSIHDLRHMEFTRQVGYEPTTFEFEVRDSITETTKGIKGLGKTQHPLTAQGQRARPNDPGLAAVIQAWDRLPEAVRDCIVAIVKSATRPST